MPELVAIGCGLAALLSFRRSGEPALVGRATATAAALFGLLDLVGTEVYVAPEIAFLGLALVVGVVWVAQLSVARYGLARGMGVTFAVIMFLVLTALMAVVVIVEHVNNP